MRTSDAKGFWARQSLAARTWGTVGLVGLFAFVAVGMFLGVKAVTDARAPHTATPSPSTGTVLAVRPGPTTSAGPSPSSLGPSGSPPPGGGSGGSSSGGSTGSGGSGTGSGGSGGSAPTAPDPPGTVTLSVVEHFNSDLAVTVRWTKPNDHGQAISRYDVIVHSAPDAPIPVSTTSTDTTVMVPCGSGCGSRTVTATVQAVNAIGSSPQASGSFAGGLPADNMSCAFAGEAGIYEELDCTLYDTNVSTVWTAKNSNAQTTYTNVSKIGLPCPFNIQFDTLVVTVSASNTAGTNVRSISYTCPL
jgi:hypothetical protein